MTQTGAPQFAGNDFANTPFNVSGGMATWECRVCRMQNHFQLERCPQCGNSFSAGLQDASIGMAIGGLSAGSRAIPGFGERVRKGFSLIGYSWRALKMDPELMWITVLAGVLITMIGLVVFNVMGGLSLADAGTTTELQLPYALFAAYYFCAYLVGVFCQGAIVSAAMRRFTGGDPTVGTALADAGRKIVPLMGWALIVSTVAMALRMLEERFRWLARTFDVAWSVVTYFVIPVIMMENQGPLGSMKRSKDILKQRWAETLVATFGIGLAMTLIMFLIMVSAWVLIMVNPLIGVIFGLAALTLGIVVGSTLSAICNAALYFYAVSGEAPVPFPSAVLRHAFPGARPQPGLI